MGIRDRIEGLRIALGEPIDGASLASFRVLFGLFAAWSALRFMWKGWVDALYVEPSFFFTYAGFDWVTPWPSWGMHLHFAALAALGILIALGLHYRLAITAWFFAFTYVELLDRSNYLNHYYLLSLVALLMIFMPLGEVYSLDARRRGDPRGGRLPAWCLWLLRFQLGIVYFFAGVAKVQPDWLLRAEPLATWLPARADLPVLGPILALPAAPWLMSWAGAIFDLGVVFFLLNRRTRLLAWGVAGVFHVVTGAMFRIGLFPWIMIAATTIFFDPAWPRAVARRLRLPVAPAPLAPASGSPRPASPSLVLALGLWAAMQLLLPMRHVLYPGDVLWTEEGFDFSWRVMVMEKAGQVDFTVHAPDGRTWIVPPRRYLAPHQLGAFATRPEMILTLAHRIALDYAAEGPVTVTADAWVSFNGRRRQRLIDPTVDLSRVDRWGGHRPWILPLAGD